MRLRDLIDPERGPETLAKLALYSLILVLSFSLVLDIVAQLPPFGVLILFGLVLLASPAAYFIREAGRGYRTRERARQGAERTPLLPQNEEDQ
jgi:hypothetical protein